MIFGFWTVNLNATLGARKYTERNLIILQYNLQTGAEYGC